MDTNQDVGRTKKKHGKKAGERTLGGDRKNRIKSGQSHAIRLALGTQFHILHWQFESQGGGSQGVDHVLVTLPTVLS